MESGNEAITWKTFYKRFLPVYLDKVCAMMWV